MSSVANASEIEKQLEQVDHLFANGKISDGEHRTARAAILAGTATANSPLRGGSRTRTLFKWGAFGCLGIVGAVLASLIAIALIVALAKSGDDDDSASAQPGQVGTNKGDVHVGLAVNASATIAPEGEPNRTIRVTIVEIAGNVTSSNGLVKPPSGMKWWGMEVLVENVGTAEVPSPVWKLRDTTDFEHERTTVAGAEKSLDVLYNLTPGGKAQGWVYFEVPVDASPKWIRVDPNGLRKNDLYFDVK